MLKNRYFPLSLIAIAILSGCSSVPQNSTLTQAHNSYDMARTNPQVASLAAVELKTASDSLAKADAALTKGKSESTVNQLAYIAKQQVGIAEETAKRKAAEAVVANASAKRDEVRLEARTAEADAAKQQAAAAQQQAAMAQQTAEQQAAALAAATANAAHDKALIAQQQQQLKELNAKQTNRGLVITLGDVLFATNKAQLSPGGMRNVQKLADYLKESPQRKVLIEGYTDSTGNPKLNQVLSEQRADAVRTALLEMGISNDRISTHGYGEAYPVASNNNNAGRQLNRRVEIILSDDNGKIIPR